VRGPGRHWITVAGAALLTVLLPVWVAEERGTAVAVVSAVLLAALVVVAVWPGYRRWSRSHRTLDALAIAPIGFVTAAVHTEWPIVACAAAGAAASLVLAGVAHRVERRRGSVPTPH